MKKLITLLTISALFFGCTKNNTEENEGEENLSRIAFGSCCAQCTGEMVAFRWLFELEPQVYIAVAIMYADFCCISPYELKDTLKVLTDN
ncbi:MAG: hypothetical protein R2807_01855 [Chitinophagales bacterium]